MATGTRSSRRKAGRVSAETRATAGPNEAVRAARAVLDLAQAAENGGKSAIATLLRSLSARLARRRT